MNNTTSIHLQELSWQDIDEYLNWKDSPTVIVPIGSTEQHGPHLPMGVDLYEAEAVASAIGERTDILVAPVIPYGDADHHLAFPGTISLSTETVVQVLANVYESLVGHGFENIITVNGHRIANLAAIETATARVQADNRDVSFATVDLVRVAAEAHRDLRDGDPDDGMHGGEFETSLMLHYHPSLVQEEQVEKETHEGFSQFQTNDLVETGDSILSPSSRHSPTAGDLGHVGDPTLATEAKGEELHEYIVANAVAFIEELRAHRASE